MDIRNFILALCAFTLLGCSDSGSSERIQNDPPQPEAKKEVTAIQSPAFEIFYKTEDNKLFIQGETNLPPGTKVGINIGAKNGSFSAQDYNVFVTESGSFISSGFSNKGNPLSGDLTGNVLLYNNSAWQSEEVVSALSIKNGLAKDDNYSVEFDIQLNIVKSKIKKERPDNFEELSFRVYILWEDLKRFRRMAEFHEYGYAKGVGALWLKNQKRLLSDWDEATKEMSTSEKFQYDTVSTIQYMRVIGLDWIRNKGNTPVSSQEMFNMIEDSVARNGVVSR